ncbi:hypothetical protein ACEN9H_23505 [Massilia cellulosiltytica]|uniref:hypothetical protein n=1 Tax=Massilia cellulosiltytica TaxID=2683234 RepID=UPI0039B4894E
MSQQHWSQRLHDVLTAKEKPSYELLEECVVGLLQERQGMTATVTDMAKKFSHIVFARMNDDTDQALKLLDEVIAKHVTVTTSAESDNEQAFAVFGDVIANNVTVTASPAETTTH